MESDFPETGFVTERLEDLAVELSPQIHFTFKTIREPQPQRMASAVLSGDEARNHGGHSKGSMRGSWPRLMLKNRVPEGEDANTSSSEKHSPRSI
jgi:hypothetical protein